MRQPALAAAHLLDDDFMKMTLEQHRELGERVKEFRETMMQPHVMSVETKASRECRATSNVLKHIDRMKSALDSLVCRDFPECEDATKIYYGVSAAWIARQAESSNAELSDRRRNNTMTTEQQKMVDSKLFTRQPEGEPPVRSSELLCREIHAHIVSRAEWWRTNPDDSHGINTAVYVAMLEVANAINSALVFKELDRELGQPDKRHNDQAQR